MPALVAGIHVLLPRRWKDVDGRDKPGHDEARHFRQYIVSDCGGSAMIGGARQKILADYQP
jgi:hypothetical protein